MLVACLLVPRFALACELADRPERVRRASALAVADRRVVLEASPSAARLGVRPGQRLAQALAHCPHLVVLEARPAAYERRFGALLDAMERIAPLVEPGPLGVAYADLRGLAPLFPRLDALAQALLACAPASFGARLGIGPGKFPAWVAARRARSGHSCVLTQETVVTWLAPASVDLLPVAADIKRRLRLLGLNTLGDLVTLPRAALAAQFGPIGARIYELAQGHDDDPVRPRPKAETIAVRASFDAPVASREAVMMAFERLLDQALRAMAQRQRAAGQALLRAATERGALWERVLTFKEALSDRARLWAAIKLALEQAAIPGPVAELGLELVALTPCVGRQETLWLSSETRQRERLWEALRQLKARYGACPLGRVVEVEPWSRIPERRAAILAFEP